MKRKVDKQFHSEISGILKYLWDLWPLITAIYRYNPQFDPGSPESNLFNMTKCLYYRSYRTTSGLGNIVSDLEMEYWKVGIMFARCEEQVLEDCINILWLYYTDDMAERVINLQASGALEGINFHYWGKAQKRFKLQDYLSGLGDNAINSLEDIHQDNLEKTTELAMERVMKTTVNDKMREIEQYLKDNPDQQKSRFAETDNILELFFIYKVAIKKNRSPMLYTLCFFSPLNDRAIQDATLKMETYHLADTLGRIALMFIGHSMQLLIKSPYREDQAKGHELYKKWVAITPTKNKQ